MGRWGGKAKQTCRSTDPFDTSTTNTPSPRRECVSRWLRSAQCATDEAIARVWGCGALACGLLRGLVAQPPPPPPPPHDNNQLCMSRKSTHGRVETQACRHRRRRKRYSTHQGSSVCCRPKQTRLRSPSPQSLSGAHMLRGQTFQTANEKGQREVERGRERERESVCVCVRVCVFERSREGDCGGVCVCVRA